MGLHSKLDEQKTALPCESTNSEESTSSMAYLAVESQAPNYYCRVCWDSSESDSEKLISPCNCRGTQKYVHVKCLRRWQDNVQKRNIRDERAFRCGVCQVRYTLAPPDPHFTTKLFQILRGLGGAACISLLAFGLAGPPWPHLALLALVLLGSRSHGMLAFALLASGTILAALHAKGLRLVMRFDDIGSPFGFAVVRHGAPVPGLGPGTLLIANNDLNHSIFKRSVVLIYQHDVDSGARGVILTQPMSSFFKQENGGGGDLSDLSEVENDLHDEPSDLAALSTTPSTTPSTKRKQSSSGTTSGTTLISSDEAVQHRLGGPVGMPGEGARQEIAVLHSVSGIHGAHIVISGEGSFPPIFVGGTLTDVLESGKDTLCNTPGTVVSSGSGGSSSELKEKKINKEEKSNGGGGGGGFGRLVANRFKRSGFGSKVPTPNQHHEQQNQQNQQENQERNQEINDNKSNKMIKNCGDDDGSGSASVLVFHGISTWAEGQLEGEIRAGAWAYGDATFEDIMKSSPSDLWRSLVRSDRIGLV